jgi:predicted transposase YdaD
VLIPTFGYYRDLKNSLDTAYDEGREEGIEIGIETGKEIGREEEKEQRTYEIAREMLNEGDPVERVARLTGLDPGVIESLRRN